MAWRAGKAVSATGWQEAMERLWGHADIRSRLWLNRGDSGFGQEAVCAWHEAAGQERPRYLFKLRLTKNVRRAIAKVPPEAWKGCPTLGTEQVAETTLQLDGWSRARRVVIARTLKPTNRGPQEEFWSTAQDEVSVYVTNLTVAEAVRSRRQFLVLAAQMSCSGRQRTWKLAVGRAWWQQLKGCYERLCLWLKSTAPQLETQRQFLRLLAFETPVDPGEWFAQTVLCPSG